ncbi:MAG: FdtA/QdtA family cupin domain-containing protein [Bacteroidia bacterium]
MIDLPKINNRAGNITSLNNNTEIPFDVKRIYYLYDVPSGVERGGHAHKDLRQLLVAGSGSFEIILNDGNEEKSIFLNRPDKGLLIALLEFGENLKNFSSGAICFVLASESCDENDYIREFEKFKLIKNE